MNKVIIIGNLGKDPELASTSNGVSVCKFSLAVPRKFKVDGEQVTDWFNIVAWREMGENCHKYLKKGKKACIIGRIELRNYEHEGVKKLAVDIVADEVEFLSPAGEQHDNYEQLSSPSKKKSTELTPVEDDSLPF